MQCSKCKVEKGPDEFYAPYWYHHGRDNKPRQRKQTQCKECVRNGVKDYRSANQEAYRRRQANYYQANKEKFVVARQATERRRLKRHVHRMEFAAWIKELPCFDCNVRYPYYVMDFDHVRGEKVMNISQMRSKFTEEAVWEEMQKCDVVCANCHRIRSYKRLVNRSG